MEENFSTVIAVVPLPAEDGIGSVGAFRDLVVAAESLDRVGIDVPGFWKASLPSVPVT